jgi:ribonuclease T2
MKQCLLLAVASLLAAQTGANFDYYLLSLSWAPEFCAQPGEAAKNPLECGQGKGFVVHGLWPEVNQGKSPESCGAAKMVPRSLVNDMLKYIPSASLIQHEWATHGTCSGLSQGDYFTKVMLARAAVQVPVQISSLGQTTTESPGEIEAQFAAANPSFPQGAVRTACQGGQLTELHVCFDKNLKALACTASAGECTSQTVTILSPR